MEDYKNIIKHYFTHYKKIDAEALKYLTESIIADRALNSYVESIGIDTSKSFEAAYFPTVGKLVINPKLILASSFNNLPQFSLILNNQELIRFYNYNCINVLLHELRHILQTKASKESSCSDKTLQMLVDEGIEFGSRLPNRISLKERILYYLFNDKVLFERDANITSCLELIDLGVELNIFSEEELRFFNRKLIQLSLKDYSISPDSEILKTPCSLYYGLRGKKHELTDLDFSSQQDNITKISWGMPIDKELYIQLNNIKKENLYSTDIKSKILNIGR